MKFKLTTSNSLYSSESTMEELQELGFKFKPVNNRGSFRFSELMFRIDGEPDIEIDTLEELIIFSNKWGKIIVSEGYIEIYNGYRE